MREVTVRCCICGGEMNFDRRYGQKACCCSKHCWDKFQNRYYAAVCDEPPPKE